MYFFDLISTPTATDTMQLLVTVVYNPIRRAVALISASASGNVSFKTINFLFIEFDIFAMSPYFFPGLRFVLEVKEFTYYAGK